MPVVRGEERREGDWQTAVCKEGDWVASSIRSSGEAAKKLRCPENAEVGKCGIGSRRGRRGEGDVGVGRVPPLMAPETWPASSAVGAMADSG
jgi:hypothetical protein